MVLITEYKTIPPRDKEKLSNRLAALLYLHRYIRIWAGNKFSTAQMIQWCEEDRSLCGDMMGEWLRWKGYSPGRKRNISECWFKWVRSELTDIFKPFFTCYCCPESVIDASRIYLNAAKQLYWETGRNDPDQSCRLLRNDWEKLEIATTALFFRKWMQSQPRMRQTIYDFAKAPFGDPLPKDQLLETDIQGETFGERRYRSLIDAHDEIGVMLDMGQAQKKRETGFDTNYEGKSNTGYLVPYTQLCAMEFISMGKMSSTATEGDASCFRIFKYISQRRDIFRTSSNKLNLTKIADSCRDYSAVLDQIAEWGIISSDGRMNDPKRYVIGSLLAMELETAYRLHFASAAASFSVAKKRKGRSNDRKILESNVAECLLGRITTENIPNEDWAHYIGCLGWESASAHNILNYSTDLKYIYSAPFSEAEIYIDKLTLLRVEQLVLMSLLLFIFQNQISRPWSDLDFENVSHFLKENYNVIDTLRKIGFPNKDDDSAKSHYLKMRSFYEMTQTWASDNDKKDTKDGNEKDVEDDNKSSIRVNGTGNVKIDDNTDAKPK